MQKYFFPRGNLTPKFLPAACCPRVSESPHSKHNAAELMGELTTGFLGSKVAIILDSICAGKPSRKRQIPIEA
jgi:hypothetical protein